VFDTAEAAQTWARENGYKPRIKKLVLDSNWREREQARFTSGEYKPLPSFITDCDWWHGSEPAKDHYTHISVEDATMVAFTPSPDHGGQDKQVRISLSTYLSRYFSRQLSNYDITTLAHRYEQHNEAGTFRQYLKYGTTMDDFERVYTTALKVCNPNSSVVSCMAWTMDQVKNRGLPRHPAVVYAKELHIAYIEMPDGSIPARVNVHPEKQTYVRLYGKDSRWQRRIEALLQEDGYREADDFDGVTLHAISTGSGGNFLMPYVDGEVQSAELLGIHDGSSGKYFRLSEDGGYCCSNTNGTVSGYDFTCERCGAGTDDPTTVDGDNWCENCAERHSTYCNYNEEYYASSTNFYDVNVGINRTETWSENALDNAFHCDRTEEYYADYRFTSIDVFNAAGNEELWCAEVAVHGTDYFTCAECGDNFTMDCMSVHKDVCNDCASAEDFVAPTATPTISDPNQQELPLEA
jgi:hypothetical protein